MNIYDIEFTLLSEEETFESKKIEVFEKIDTKCAISDFAILLGGTGCDGVYVNGDNSLKGRTCLWYLLSSYYEAYVDHVDHDGKKSSASTDRRYVGVRPALTYSSSSDISLNGVSGSSGLLEVEYGEYPQYAVEKSLNKIIENEYLLDRLKKTGKKYTTDSRRWDDYFGSFNPIEHEEFEYKGKKYVRVKSNCNERGRKLSNGVKVMPNDIVWLEVSPIKWYVSKSSRMLISKIALVSGIRFSNNRQYRGDFKNTEMYMFLNKYFAKDIVPSIDHEMTPEEAKRKNYYGLTFNDVSEEDILLGAIETDIAAFLHGRSSEGKSARVKQIDPDCTIIYLRNATPESLNGKSVYNAATGEMIDIKPTWLTKLEEKCAKEPKKLHILFFDEITNALPSIQGSAFNIILEKEVDGKWHLPENARIVAAGNEMSDSLAANQLAEPLFNRFAHIYIETTVEKWLKWASKNNIHPAIFAFISYRREKALRSKYTGEKPNADPRKWEMASKMLYKTGSAKMINPLIGEELTNEFVAFCNQKVISLEDVINGNYTKEELKYLNTAERYATIAVLLQVDEENMFIVREFVKKLKEEYLLMFDAFWTKDNEKRLELLAETILKEKTK